MSSFLEATKDDVLDFLKEKDLGEEFAEWIIKRK